MDVLEQTLIADIITYFVNIPGTLSQISQCKTPNHAKAIVLSILAEHDQRRPQPSADSPQ